MKEGRLCRYKLYQNLDKIQESNIEHTLPRRERITSQSSDSSSVDMVFPHIKRSAHRYKDAEGEVFQVIEPLMGNHVTYTVKGIDNDGEFSGSRRYNDFNSLRKALITRWPGIYFPPIPPKRKVGNKEIHFVEERRYFLQRFLIKLAQQDFILSSEEFKIFSRFNGDIEKQFMNLPKLNLDMLFNRLKSTFGINDDPPRELLLRCKVSINEFQEFHGKIIPVLKSL